MRNATPVLPFKMRRPTRRHYFLRVNFRPFSFFTRTTRAKINPAEENDGDGRWIPDTELLTSRCDTWHHTTVHTAAAGASPSVVQRAHQLVSSELCCTGRTSS